MARWIHRAMGGWGDAPPSPLARLLDDWSVLGAVLVDVDSGMTLTSFQGRGGGLDLELLGASHADLVRGAVDALGSLHPVGPPTELVLSHDGELHHLMRTVADPYGGTLVLAVVVAGPARTVARMRQRMRRIDARTLVPRPVSARPAHSAAPPARRTPATPMLPAARAPVDALTAGGDQVLPVEPIAAYGGAARHPDPPVPATVLSTAGAAPSGAPHPALRTLPLPPVPSAGPDGAEPARDDEPTWFTPGATPPHVAAPVPQPPPWTTTSDGYPPPDPPAPTAGTSPDTT